MIFTETRFWLFYLVVCTLIVANARLVRSITVQHVLLLAASYYFYAVWDARFAALILVTTAVNFVCGGRIPTAQAPKL